MGTGLAMCSSCFEDILLSADNPTLICPKCVTENRSGSGPPSIPQAPPAVEPPSDPEASTPSWWDRALGRKQMFCTACGDLVVTRARGDGGVELLLWLLLCLPGLIYSAWRYSGWKCCRCGGQALIPADSPNARRMMDRRTS